MRERVRLLKSALAGVGSESATRCIWWLLGSAKKKGNVPAAVCLAQRAGHPSFCGSEYGTVDAPPQMDAWG